MVFRRRGPFGRHRSGIPKWWTVLIGIALLLGVGMIALTKWSTGRPTGAAAGVEAAAGSAGDEGGSAVREEDALQVVPAEVAPVGAAGEAEVAQPAVRRPVGADVFPAVAAPRVAKPGAVRGIYLNAFVAGSPRKRAQLYDLAAKTEINTFVVDVKEGGEVSYATGVALARAIGATRAYIPDIRAFLAEARAHGIYPIARIVVFKDPVLAAKRPEWAIQQEDGTPWRDDKGKLWVDPYNRNVWDYNVALAREAVLLGFSEVQWDYVRFPDVPQRMMQNAVFPTRQGRSRERAIREFLQYSRTQLADLGVPVTADVFGLTVSVANDLGIGQRWEQMADVADALLPMVYPSHFARGSYGIPVPNADPYQTVKTALDHAVERSGKLGRAAAIRPWLQDFSLGWPAYGPAEVRAQIRAVYDAGLTEWILWNPGSRYTAAALASASGVAPDLPLPRHTRPPARESAPQQTEPAVVPAPRVLGVPVSEH